MRLYADRILATGDKIRLANPLARAAVRSAVGIYRELAGGLVDALEEKLPAATTVSDVS
jgi:hypothetical protein